MLDDLRITTLANTRDNVRALARSIKMIAIAKFKHTLRRHTMCGITSNTLQTAKQQSLTQAIQIIRQRIEQTHAILASIAVKTLTIGTLLQRIVKNLMKTIAHQHLCHQILKFVALVSLPLDRERRLDRSRNLDIVVAIYTENLLDHITRTLHVHAISRNLKSQPFPTLFQHDHLQTLAYRPDHLSRNMLADEHIYIIIAQINDKVLDRLRININNFHAHLGTSQLLCHDSSLFQSIDLSVRVDTALKAERSISLQSMTSATLAYPSRIEISTLQQDILRRLIRTTTLSPKHTSNTHRLHSITDSQVPLAQSVFHTIESHKRSTLRHSLDNDLITLNHISIKAMQRLSIRHHDIISDVDNIVDRTQADDRETILQPFGTFLDNTILQRQRTIARTSLRSHNTHRNLELSIIHDKTIARRTMQSSPVAILYQPGIQVARHTIVATSIGTIWSNIHLNQKVALQLIVFSSRRTHDGILRQHDDTIMTFTNSDFVLSTNHA